MPIGVGKHIKSLCEEIKRNTSSGKPLNKLRFGELLKTIEGIEKYLIARYFCSLPWNIGSLAVLATLQRLGILSAKEYILSLQDSEEIQLILNDFLEAEFELIVNLFIASSCDSTNSVHLSDILNECIRRLYMDLVKNPTLNNLQYLRVAHEILPSNLFGKFSHNHLNIITSLHTSKIEEAFENFSHWINEGVDNMKFIKDLHDKLLRFNEEDTWQHLFSVSTMEQFSQWKFYLIILQTLASQGNQATLSNIKKHLRNRFRHLATVPCLSGFLHLLLSTRACTATTLDVGRNINSYADWYKQNIAEMKYVLKAEEFRNVIKLLEECVDYEMETDYIEIHASITIAPPVMCGKLVQAYKAKCKQRLALIKSKLRKAEAGGEDAVESILLEDSD